MLVGTGAAIAPTSSPQKGQELGSRQRSRRKRAGERKLGRDRKPGHRVSDRGPLHTRSPPEQAQALQSRYATLPALTLHLLLQLDSCSVQSYFLSPEGG